jgi:hypothetical protein
MFQGGSIQQYTNNDTSSFAPYISHFGSVWTNNLWKILGKVILTLREWGS